MQDLCANHPLRRLFRGLVEDAFYSQVGMGDPELTEYLADLLVAFSHMDRLHAIRNASGKRLDQIVSMLAVLHGDQTSGLTDRNRTMYQHIGDYTLFWAGVYPEQLKRACRDRSDVLLDYVSQGKRCYAMVSTLSGEHDQPPPRLFRHLSDDFEFCVYGLGLVRRGWEQTQVAPDRPGELLL